MASFIESFLGGAAEGLNEQFDMKRKEERANRMLTKELELRRDFGIEDERRLEEKKAKKNISALSNYFTPANVDAIVGRGPEAVAYALANGQKLRDLNRDPNAIVNSAFIEAKSGGTSRFVGDKGYTGFVKDHIKGIKQPPARRIKRTPDKSKGFFLGVKPTLDIGEITDWDEGLVNLTTKVALAVPNSEEQKQLEEALVKFKVGYDKYKKNNPSAADTSPINQGSLYKDTKHTYLAKNGIKGEYDEGMKAYNYIFEGQEGKYLTSTVGGLNQIIAEADRFGYSQNGYAGRREREETFRSIRSHQNSLYNSKISEDGTILKGKEGGSFQFASAEIIQKRMNEGLIPEGGTYAFINPKNPEEIVIRTYSKYFKPSFATTIRPSKGIKF